ncbi:MAG TPA: endopeptidase La [bacterium]|nr:endopeptidase La [bacterium]
MKSGKFFPLLPIRDAVVFPYTSITFKVGRDFSIKAIENALKNPKKEIVLVTQKDPDSEAFNLNNLFEIGTLCTVIQVIEGPGDFYHVFLEGIKRVSVSELKMGDSGFYEISVKNFKSTNNDKDTLEKIRKIFEVSLVKYFEFFEIPKDVLNEAIRSEDHEKFLDLAASVIRPANPLDIHPVLAQKDIVERYKSMISLIKMETELRELERDIESNVREKFEKGQKEFFINEHINALKNELNKNSENQDYDENDDIAEKIQTLDAPEHVLEKLKEEYSRYEMTSPMSAESGVIRTYLETVTGLPWRISSDSEIDMKNAEKVLDDDHYGLDEVKKRILEYLAVLKLKGDLKAPIICLVGPPGVGKTSIASSIARATGRKFVRQSLGGIKDEAEIRGHRRTYIGAMPGKIIQSLNKVKVNNPLFLLDEIDKLSSDYKGDPASALLEVLDPEQNDSFIDHYIDLEFDLSKVLFIATANDRSMIPPALRDRMEIIELDGYTWFEKKNIALKYLIKKQKFNNGIDDISLVFSQNGLESLIEKYTSESGVRELERKIASICRKIALKKAMNPKNFKEINITEKNINEYLGPEKYNEKISASENEIGVVNGLAWTPYGGTVLKIEAIKYSGKGEIKITGSLGDVMKESVDIAVSYVKSLTETLAIDKDDWNKYTVHIHFPEGATPKDGPSAGVAISLAVASLMTGRKVKPFTAMTGEVTLRGKVLKIGGLKAKIMAASREGIKKVYIPDDNMGDFSEIPEEIRSGITVIPVKCAESVISGCLEIVKKVKKTHMVTAGDVCQ